MMYFTIFNYSSPSFLQPLYFKSQIDSIDGCASSIINNTNNVYEVYDKGQPQYSILNAGMSLNDFIHYNKHSGSKVKHLLNIDYIKDQYIPDLQAFVKHEKDFECKLIFSTNFKHKNIKFDAPYVHIGNCVDTNIKASNKTFDIDKAVVVRTKEDKKKYEGTCHFMQINNGQDEGEVDFSVNNITAGKLLCNYKEVVVRNIDPNIIPEVFFNALYFGNAVYFDNDENSEAVDEVLRKMFKVSHSFDYNKKEIYDKPKIIQVIEEKHTPKNRIKQLLSNLSDTQEVISKL